MSVLGLAAAITLFATPQRIGAQPEQARRATTGYLSISGEGFVVDAQPFVMRGFNYYPRNYGWSAMTDWDWSEVDQELALAAGLGSNTIRTVVDYGFSTDHSDQDWTAGQVTRQHQPSAAYLAAMDQLLTIANRHGLRVVFSLFDFMPGWAFIDRAQYGLATTYVTELVSHFADDPRIAAWDILNEGDMLPDKFPTTNQAAVLHFYAAMSTAIRSVDHRHLLTADFARIERADLSQNFVDYVSFHYYGDQARMTQEITALRGRLRHPMPIVASEVGAPSSGNQWATLSSHTVALGGYLDVGLNAPVLAGILIWTLVDPNPPRTSRTRQGLMELVNYGVYDGALQPKASAQMVRRYFAGECGPGTRIELRFPGPQPGPTPSDSRFLMIGLHQLTLSRADGSAVSQLTFGTLEADALEGRGWYANENWGQWAGELSGTAALCVSVPADTATVSLTAHSRQPDAELQVWVNGSMRGTFYLQPTVDNYLVALNQLPAVAVALAPTG
jgi:hypothetical protein